MALLFIDGFDHYGTVAAALFAKWDGNVGVNAPVTSPVRTGTGALFLPGGGSTLTKVLPVPGDVFIVGFALRLTGSSSGLFNLIQFQEGGTIHVAVSVDTSGFLVVKRGATVLATATANALVTNNWAYVEIKVVIHDTLGSVECRIDGVTVPFSASLTGVDTRNAGTGIVDRFVLQGLGTNLTYADDLYVCDDAGTTNNDFRGICVVETLLPQSATPGDLQDFTCSTGTDHGALVDETPPNDDTDYTSSTTVGQQDSYNYPSLSLTGAILGVQSDLYVRKTDVGVRTVAPVLRLGGVTYPGAAVPPLTSYRYLPTIAEVNPATGVAWTSTDIAALQVGMKIVS